MVFPQMLPVSNVQVKLSVAIKDFGSAKVAERVAMLMLQKLRSGTKEAGMLTLREQLRLRLGGMMCICMYVYIYIR